MVSFATGHPTGRPEALLDQLAPSDPRPPGRSAWLVAPTLLALALGLLVQGARGLGEPDEGRNAQIATAMLASGDWLVPRLDGAIYLDKPPITFWLVAGSVRVLGRTEWAARLPHALALGATTAFVAWLGTMLWGARTGRWAGLAYALSLGPFAGAAVLTPDTLLTCAVTATAALLWRAAHDGARLRFWLLAGAAAGAGLMVKGAAMLLFAAPLFLGVAILRRGLRWLAAPGPWLAFGAALALGLPWYVWAGLHLPGAATYFYSNQVTGRLVEEAYERNSELSKLFTLYLPTLVGGALPWSLGWPSRARSLVLRWRRRQLAAPAAQGWYVGLWFFLPLAVFCAASSRLPLYLLPLFAPLALFTGRSIAIAGAGTWRATLRSRRVGVALCALWALALGAVKLTAALRVEHRDGRRLANWVAGEIAARPPADGIEIWAVDADVHALPFYGLPVPRSATMRPEPYPMFQPDLPLATALAAARPPAPLLITTRQRLAGVRAVAEASGYRCREGRPDLRLGLLDCRRQGESADRSPKRKRGRDRNDRESAPAAPDLPHQTVAATHEQARLQVPAS